MEGQTCDNVGGKELQRQSTRRSFGRPAGNFNFARIQPRWQCRLTLGKAKYMGKYSISTVFLHGSWSSCAQLEKKVLGVNAYCNKQRRALDYANAFSQQQNITNLKCMVENGSSLS